MEKSNLGNPSDLEKNQILEAHEKAFEIEVLTYKSRSSAAESSISRRRSY